MGLVAAGMNGGGWIRVWGEARVDVFVVGVGRGLVSLVLGRLIFRERGGAWPVAVDSVLCRSVGGGLGGKLDWVNGGGVGRRRHAAGSVLCPIGARWDVGSGKKSVC